MANLIFDPTLKDRIFYHFEIKFAMRKEFFDKRQPLIEIVLDTKV